MRKADRVHPESLDDSRQKVYRLADIERPESCEATAGEPKRPGHTRPQPTSRHTLPVAPDLLEQNFAADALDQKWVSDITSIWTEKGWLYLAVVLELYSRQVMGWAIAERMTAALVCDALRMALWRRHRPKDMIVHADRGNQYFCAAYQRLISKHPLICSMSKKGDCDDNAAMESWNHSFKVEALHGERFLTRADAKYQVFDWFEVYYHRKRLHSHLGYLSPEALKQKKSLSRVSIKSG
jgi:putative transposase